MVAEDNRLGKRDGSEATQRLIVSSVRRLQGLSAVQGGFRQGQQVGTSFKVAAKGLKQWTTKGRRQEVVTCSSGRRKGADSEPAGRTGRLQVSAGRRSQPLCSGLGSQFEVAEVQVDAEEGGCRRGKTTHGRRHGRAADEASQRGGSRLGAGCVGVAEQGGGPDVCWGGVGDFEESRRCVGRGSRGGERRRRSLKEEENRWRKRKRKARVRGRWRSFCVKSF